MKNEMRFFNSVMHGEPVPDEFKPLLNGRAARRPSPLQTPPHAHFGRIGR